MKVAPVIAVELGLVSVTVMVEEPLISIVPGLKPLATAGGANTVSVADAALPGNVFAVVTTPVLFTYAPAVVAVTGTTMEQLLDAGMVTFNRDIELPPLAMFTMPPHVLDVGAEEVFFISVEG